MIKDYRPEIDILRAVAIVSVIINHYFSRFLPSGFLGVDVFFVISGYLIGSQILDQLKTDSFSYREFYKRRIKRLSPAFFSLLFFTSIFAWFLFLPEDLLRYCKSLLANIFYGSNFYFGFLFDYFSQDSRIFPLLHTWSLAVEEQFYFLIPALLSFSYGFKNRLREGRTAIVLLTLISLILAQWIFYQESWRQLGYYLLPTRFFEMALGVLLADFSGNINILSRNNKGLKNILGWLGLFILVVSFLVNSPDSHPGFFTLLPVLGTLLAIQFWSMAQTKFNVPVIYVGKISYSLYLWHWPLLSFYEYTFGRNQQNRSYHLLSLLIFAFIFASLSYHFIEQRLRYKQISFRKTLITYLGIPSFILSGFSMLAIYNNGMLQAGMKARLEEENIFLAPQFCYNKIEGTCQIGTENQKPKILLFGDSHAGHFIAMLDELFKRNKISAVGISISNCYPLFDLGTSQPSEFKKNDVPPFAFIPKCSDVIKDLTGKLADFDYIILAGRWVSLLESGYQKSFPFFELLKLNLREFSKLKKHIIILEQVPEFTQESFDLSRRIEMISGQKSDRYRLSPATETTNLMMKDLTHIDPNYINYVSLRSALGNKIENLPYLNEKFIYSDYNHLKESGARHFAVTFEKELWSQFSLSEK